MESDFCFRSATIAELHHEIHMTADDGDKTDSTVPEVLIAERPLAVGAEGNILAAGVEQESKRAVFDEVDSKSPILGMLSSPQAPVPQRSVMII